VDKTEYVIIFDLNTPSLHEPLEKLDEIGKTILNLFKRKS